MSSTYANYASDVNAAKPGSRKEYATVHTLKAVKAYSPAFGELISLNALNDIGADDYVLTQSRGGFLGWGAKSVLVLSPKGSDFLKLRYDGIEAVRPTLVGRSVEQIGQSFPNGLFAANVADYAMLNAILTRTNLDKADAALFSQPDLGSRIAEIFGASRSVVEKRVLDRVEDIPAFQNAFPEVKDYLEAMVFYDLLFTGTTGRVRRGSVPAAPAPRVYVPDALSRRALADGTARPRRDE